MEQEHVALVQQHKLFIRLRIFYTQLIKGCTECFELGTVLSM